MAKKKDYIIEMEKVRAAQNVIEKLFLSGDPEGDIHEATAEEMKTTYWEVIGEPIPEGVTDPLVPGNLNSWNC